MDIHLDPLGGWSGDMFVAAMLDAFPEFWPDVQAAVASLALGPEAECSLVAHRDAVLTGRRFRVAAEPAGVPRASHEHRHDAPADHPHDDEHDAHSSHDHGDGGTQRHGGHKLWAAIRDEIARSSLDAAVKDHAIAIYRLLARAEAEVHGVPEDDVAFHEVGAVDSTVDIVAAAVLIARVGATRWSASPLPLGSGRVRTAHGLLPVPAPATALLLRGLQTIDDGIGGERVTPTGAAVARHLLGDHSRPAGGPRRLLRTGTGFGTRTLPGISNCLRALAFEPDAHASAAGCGFTHRELGVIAFEVDDQSAEDLAAGLDHVRAVTGVHDVMQGVAFGKKGRVAAHIQVLVAPAALDGAIAACFSETTTIGLRYHVVHGAALPRDFDEVEVSGKRLRVKRASRPDGTRTAKGEAADVASERGHANRARLRHQAEAAVLARKTGPEDIDRDP